MERLAGARPPLDPARPAGELVPAARAWVDELE